MGQYGKHGPLVRLCAALWLWALAALPAGAEGCRLALVLALDVSSSVDEVEYDLQRLGLAAALDAPDGDGALTAWAAARRARTARIVEAANRNARAYHLRGPVRHLAHAGLRLGGLVAPGAALGRFAWIYDHDVTTGAAATAGQ